jgi:hypothetical protein
MGGHDPTAKLPTKVATLHHHEVTLLDLNKPQVQVIGVPLVPERVPFRKELIAWRDGTIY